MKKASLEIRKKYKTEYLDKSEFAANARLLQSMWRENNQIPLLRTWGNYLSIEQAYCKQLNFISDKVRLKVKEEVDANELATGKNVKVLKTDRLYENLLASQPLAFNLFAELITPDFDIASKVFNKIFGDRIKKIISIDFEISPGRGDIKYTGDRSAFDVFIKYEGIKGNGFIGIEVKYAETLLDKPANYKERYKEIAISSDKFTEEGIIELCKMPMSIEQIWRDHLLALSMLAPVNNDFDDGFFVYLFPKENTECVNALDKYFKLLKFNDEEKAGLSIVYMQQLVDEIKSATNETKEQWILDFEDRYLRFDKLDEFIK